MMSGLGLMERFFLAHHERGVKGWFRGAPMANLDYRLGEGVGA